MTAGTFEVGGPQTAVAVRARSLARAPRLELIWFLLLLAIVGLVHGINMFDYPFYENDEGTYLSQAWSLITAGELAPYTYWYDHAPFGWIQIALWTLLTGGFYTFGDSVEGGRVLMLLYHLGSVTLLYLLARRLTGSVLIASLVVLLFGLSAYGLYFHRRVLLDNIATFWALLSLWVLVAGRMSLWRAWASALFLALGVLSKELVVFLVPALAYVAWYRSHPSHRALAAAGWLTIAGAVTSLYVLLAILKGELFPSGTWLGGDTEHVSLLGSLSYQASRANEGGAFWHWASTWSSIDPVLVAGGTVAAGINVLAWRRNRIAGAVGLMTFSLWLFLARGGVVIEFYLVPLLPFLALSLGLAMHSALRLVKRSPARTAWVGDAFLRIVAIVVVLGGSAWGYVVSDALGTGGNPIVFWTSPQAQPQRVAIDWVRGNLAPTDLIVIDAYTWTDLHDPPADQRAFDLAHWYWKIDLDPDIRDEVLEGDWRAIDFLMRTPQMENNLANANDGLVIGAAALEHSTPIASWDADGWEVAVNRVDKVRSLPASSNSILSSMWAQYKAAFLDEGRVIDPAVEGRTTSEGQGYALLQAVYQGDRGTFDAVWNWTHDELQQPSGLFAWLYGVREDGSDGVVDRGAAVDADQDIALALLFASKRWEDDSYARSAERIIDAIWRDLTTDVRGERYVVAGQWAASSEAAVVNPSYLAPYTYRIFADADPEHSWEDVVDSSYRVFQAIATSPELGSDIGAPANWVAIDRTTGAVGPASEMGDYGTRFSFDASRIPWRLAVDWMWFRDERAQQLLTGFDLPRREIERTGRLAAEYRLDGSVFADYESISMYAGTLPGLLLGGAEELAYDVLARKIISPLLADDSQVGYYDSNWAWFSTALVDGGIANLWAGSDRYVWIDRVRSATGDRAGE